MLEAAYAGNVNVWAISEGLDVIGAVVTTLQRYPTGLLVGQVLFADGKNVLSHIGEFRQMINAWAKAYGATEVEWLGREERVKPSGWARFFPDAVCFGAISSVPVL